jgi:hypothetical protein
VPNSGLSAKIKGRITMKTVKLICSVVCLCFLAVLTVASPAPAGYHLLKTVPLAAAPGGAEYFDYILLDAPTRRVYVSHGTEVVVLNADDWSVVGTRGGLKRCHGVALVPALGKGFITDGDAEKVMVFNIESLKITGEIKTQPDTDSIIYDPASKLIFTLNGDSKNSSVIDPAKETVVKTIPMGGGVEFPAVDGKGMLYCSGQYSDPNSRGALAGRTGRTSRRHGNRRKEPAAFFLGTQSTVRGDDGCRLRKSSPVISDLGWSGR